MLRQLFAALTLCASVFAPAQALEAGPALSPKLATIMVATDTYRGAITQTAAVGWSNGIFAIADKLGVMDAYSLNKGFKRGCATAEIGGAWLDRFQTPAIRFAMGGQTDAGKLRFAGGIAEYLPTGNTLGEWRPTAEAAGRVSYHLSNALSLGLRVEWKSIHDWRELPNDVADVFGNKVNVGPNLNYNRGKANLGVFIAPNRTSVNLGYEF